MKGFTWWVAGMMGLAVSSGTVLAEEPGQPGGGQWRFMAGGEFNANPHGILDLGYRRGDLSVQLLTDTLELRYAPESDGGRWWVAVRGEGGAAGLMISPWVDGAPDPASALLASYAGVEGGKLFYLPHGFYAGAQALARLYTFGPASSLTTAAIPGLTPLATVDALLGYYSPTLSGWSRLGVDREGETFSPHAHLSLAWNQPIRGQLHTRVGVNAGVAEGQDIITLTRVGGLNPYVIPLSGAAWAEWWVEDYAAAQVAISRHSEHLDVEVFADGATFEEEWVWGLGTRVQAYRGPWFVNAALGYAPTIERQPDIGRSSVFVLVGRQWSPIHRG